MQRLVDILTALIILAMWAFIAIGTAPAPPAHAQMYGADSHEDGVVHPDPYNDPVIIYIYSSDIMSQEYIELGRKNIEVLKSWYPTKFHSFEIDCHTLNKTQIHDMGLQGVPAYFFYSSVESYQLNMVDKRVYGLVPAIDLAEALLEVM